MANEVILNTGTVEGESPVFGGMTCAVAAGKDEYDLYVCHACGRLITPEDERKAMTTGVVCPCGSTPHQDHQRR